MPVQFNTPYVLQKIKSTELDSEITDRLYDMGFLEGMTIIVEKRLPFNGPWIVSSESLYVALRNEEFQRLELK